MQLEGAEWELRRMTGEMMWLAWQKEDADNVVAQGALRDYQAHNEGWQEGMQLALVRRYDDGWEEGWEEGRNEGWGEGREDRFYEGRRTRFKEGNEISKREERKNMVLLYDRWKDMLKHFDEDRQVILERPLFSKGGRGKVCKFPLSLYTLT
jgi:flagellar biosynthesis/type III secretory pathway protein FliH